MKTEKWEGIWVLFVIVVAGILAVTAARADGTPVDQRTHWQLNSGLKDTKTDTVTSVHPSSSKDFTQAECKKVAQLLVDLLDLEHSPDGRYEIAFGCVPQDKTDI